MKKYNSTMTILVAEDDEEDRLLIRRAIRELQAFTSVHFVEDGEQALDFLLHQGNYTDASQYPRPGILLLDLNMPKMDGREVILALRNNPDFATLPLVVFSTSKAKEDIEGAYHIGANSFIPKPSTFSGFVDVMNTLNHYWFHLVALPKI